MSTSSAPVGRAKPSAQVLVTQDVAQLDGARAPILHSAARRRIGVPHATLACVQ